MGPHRSRSAHREWDDNVRIRKETGTPEGCKVEIIEGIVTVAPPPSNARDDLADLVQRELYQVIPRDRGIHRDGSSAQ